jgi:hypothetical protein
MLIDSYFNVIKITYLKLYILQLKNGGNLASPYLFVYNNVLLTLQKPPPPQTNSQLCKFVFTVAQTVSVDSLAQLLSLFNNESLSPTNVAHCDFKRIKKRQ